MNTIKMEGPVTVSEEAGWRKYFTRREQQEIAFNHNYARMFNHGTDGHMARTIISKMAELLDGVAREHGDAVIPPPELFSADEAQPQ